MSRIKFACVVFSIVSAITQSASASEAPIVGGSRVPSGKWRDVVVVVGRDGTCTGTLVAPDVVLTAGHCIASGPIEIISDTINYGLPGGGGDRIAVKWARAYPDWENRYDIGVLMLEHVARGRPRKVAAACDARKALVEGSAVHVVGFGKATTTANDRNTAMREADVPVLDPTCTMDAACERSIAPHGEFMAGGNGVDTCFGDSGGPAYLETDEGPALVGVVSRGLALPGVPCGNGGVYVRADKVVSWIQSVTGAKLERTTCAGPADGDGAESEDDAGGCAAGAGAGLAAGLVVLALAWRRRRRLRS